MTMENNSKIFILFSSLFQMALFTFSVAGQVIFMLFDQQLLHL